MTRAIRPDRQPNKMRPLVLREDVQSVLNETRRRGGEWAEIFVERRDNQTVRLENGGVAEARSDRDTGAALRVSVGTRSGSAYTNLLGRESLVEAAVAAAATLPQHQNAGRDPSVDLRARNAPQVQIAQISQEVHPRDVIDCLRRIDAAARETSGQIVNVSITYVAVIQDVLVANTEGLLVTDKRVRTRVTCRATARRDGRTATGFHGPGAGVGFELYEQHPPESIGVTAAQRAVQALDGVEAPAGTMPVVLGPAGGGLLLHEACGHGLEGDGLARDSSIFARTQGGQVASTIVTAIDDPTLLLAFGSYGMDDEGTISAPTTLIADGVQVGAMTDGRSAAQLGRQPSGNGRRESYAHRALPRMSNTYIAPGRDDPADIIASVERGVYIRGFKGGDVDIASGEFGFTAVEAYSIENGHLTSPLAGLTLLGNGPDALRSIRAVGFDLEFTQALCGSGDQWVPVSYGSPTLLITGLTLTGRSS